MYFTYTAQTNGDGSKDPLKAATTYIESILTVAYPLRWLNGDHGYAFDLTMVDNRRVFAMASDGIPDGIKVDQSGNLYPGCGDGANVWSFGGVLLGKILVKGGNSNFSFGHPGVMFILNENKIYRAQLSHEVHGTLIKTRGELD